MVHKNQIIGFMALFVVLWTAPAAASDLRVIDGDTIHIGKEKIRLIDFDTPEIRGKCDAERRLARLAKKRLQALLSQGYRIERTGVDRYQRTLARVWVGDEMVSTIMVREGYARTLFWDKGERRRPWC